MCKDIGFYEEQLWKISHKKLAGDSSTYRPAISSRNEMKEDMEISRDDGSEAQSGI